MFKQCPRCISCKEEPNWIHLWLLLVLFRVQHHMPSCNDTSDPTHLRAKEHNEYKTWLTRLTAIDRKPMRREFECSTLALCLPLSKMWTFNTQLAPFSTYFLMYILKKCLLNPAICLQLAKNTSKLYGNKSLRCPWSSP